MKSASRSATASLAALIVLQAIMLGSLYAGVEPHPPAAIPLFAIGPFLGAAIAAALAALILGPLEGAGRLLSGIAALAGLISFGPQKYFDPQFTLIWPAVLAGQVAALTIVFASIRALRSAPGPESPEIG